MTYHEDVAAVKDSFKKMLEKGLYKADLFADLWYTGSGSSLRCSINHHTPLREYYGAAGSSAIIRFALASYTAVLLPVILYYIYRT